MTDALSVVDKRRLPPTGEPATLLLPREAVAQTPAAEISCRNRTNTTRGAELNQSIQAAEGSEEAAHDAGPEHADARLCPPYNRRRLCDSLA
jgi:hypothetical protein